MLIHMNVVLYVWLLSFSLILSGVICIAVYVKLHLFLLMISISFACYILSIHLFIDGHLGCFQFLCVMNSAAKSIHV